MPIAEVEAALRKFKKDEATINCKLKTIDDSRERIVLKNFESFSRIQSVLTEEEAVKRNKALVSELETVKGNLRSKAIYSPLEMQWKKICENYKADQALPVTTWKCVSPVFV
ncbi:uncharacterized protein LOC126885576 [Diabrotica virgifera virgifera]|uniref:Uncharacterized protein n=1 Tax=Diabrotica virgifera virgifera TaxID=50390 RepID=A0ABM5KD57_DIAVI|nr:uncharacterized protein LOC126885576 [Diabrotica virgifera virgifera]